MAINQQRLLHLEDVVGVEVGEVESPPTVQGKPTRMSPWKKIVKRRTKMKKKTLTKTKKMKSLQKTYHLHAAEVEVGDAEGAEGVAARVDLPQVETNNQKRTKAKMKVSILWK